jgi:hypothetical protein
MSNWKVSDVLEHIQELVGEPAGSYYNLSSRLRQLSQAQLEMVEEARAMETKVHIPTEMGQQTYYLPEDFLTYSKEMPYYVDAAKNTYQLRVVDSNWMDTAFPGWQSEGQFVARSKPQYIIMRTSQKVDLWPVPGEPVGEMVVPYVQAPAALTDLDDEVFQGFTNLNRFAIGLAYKVAAQFMMPRAPELGRQYMTDYNREVRKMRSATRSNPQHGQVVRPTTYSRRRNYAHDA